MTPSITSSSGKEMTKFETSQPSLEEPPTGKEGDVVDTSRADESMSEIDENLEYPTGIKLALITLALCLSVFLVALVRCPG